MESNRSKRRKPQRPLTEKPWVDTRYRPEAGAGLWTGTPSTPDLILAQIGGESFRRWR
jgi:hypothetical protein